MAITFFNEIPTLRDLPLTTFHFGRTNIIQKNALCIKTGKKGFPRIREAILALYALSRALCFARSWRTKRLWLFRRRCSLNRCGFLNRCRFG